MLALQAWYIPRFWQLVLCKLSFILQAWVFAAIDDEEQAAKYYAFAAVYTLPLLRNGFTFDGFLAAAVLICAAHVQVKGLHFVSKQDSHFKQYVEDLSNNTICKQFAGLVGCET